LRLSDSDVQFLLIDVTDLLDIPISIGADHHLTDVFDLMVYVLLRSTEVLEQLPDFN